MSSDFGPLVAAHGSPDKIPHDALYEFLNTNRELIAGLRRTDPTGFTRSELAVEVRRRCKRDLFWLARYFTWETTGESAGGTKPISENMLLEDTHKRMCEFFVQKDDTKPLREQDTVIKNRTLLWPRGGMKSTCDEVDVVQWILNFPDIRILFLTGVEVLAQKFINETKGHFLVRPAQPTLMNLFFPEFCDEDEELGSKFEFICPVFRRKQIKRGEPTVMAGSVDMTLAGFHFEVMKGDDAVNDINAKSAERCKSVTEHLKLKRKMLMPWGYWDKIGTRYHVADAYGADIAAVQVGEYVRIMDGPNVEIFTNSSRKLKVMIARGIVLKPGISEKLEAEGKPINYIEAGEDGCTLLLPNFLSYSLLMSDYSSGESSEVVFEGQINQNPTPKSEIAFDRSLLQRNTVPFYRLPETGPVMQIWDFAWGAKRKKKYTDLDYCTAVSIIWDTEYKAYAHDMIRDRFKPAELAKAVVAFAKKWHPFMIAIENSGFSEALEPAIIVEALKTGDDHVIEVCGRIEWIPVDNSEGAKKSRMRALHPLMSNGQFFFSGSMPYLEAAHDEFEGCLGDPLHDDIPDVISYYPRFSPRMMQLADPQERYTSWSQIVQEGVSYSEFTRSFESKLIYAEEACDAYGNSLGIQSAPVAIPVDPDDYDGETWHPVGMGNMMGTGLRG